MVENVKHLIVNHFDKNIDVSDLNDEKRTRISLIKFDIFFPTISLRVQLLLILAYTQKRL